jgi:hypothetical protein
MARNSVASWDDSLVDKSVALWDYNLVDTAKKTFVLREGCNEGNLRG